LTNTRTKQTSYELVLINAFELIGVIAKSTLHLFSIVEIMKLVFVKCSLRCVLSVHWLSSERLWWSQTFKNGRSFHSNTAVRKVKEMVADYDVTSLNSLETKKECVKCP